MQYTTSAAKAFQADDPVQMGLCSVPAWLELAYNQSSAHVTFEGLITELVLHRCCVTGQAMFTNIAQIIPEIGNLRTVKIR